MTDELLAQMDHARQRAYEDGAAAGYAEGQPERAELAATVAELSAERDALLDELCKLLETNLKACASLWRGGVNAGWWELCYVTGDQFAERLVALGRWERHATKRWMYRPKETP